MKEFNLSEWLQDKSHKVVTRNGKPVRIVCWDIDSDTPILVAFRLRQDREEVFAYGIDGKSIVNLEYDLFFAGEEKTNKILDELKSYLEKTPKEQVEKDWKEIQDWYAQHFTNENHNDEVELTEFEKELNRIVQAFVDAHCYLDKVEIHHYAKGLLNLARKEIEKSIEDGAIKFAKSYMDDVNPSFEKVQESKELWKWKMSCFKAVNKAYTAGKQDALKDLAKWKRSNSFFNTGNKFELGKTSLRRFDGYEISYSELENLPKEE